MDTALVYVALGFGALSSAIALFFFMSRTRLQESITALQNKLTLEQARIAELTNRTPAPKSKAEPKHAQDNNKHANELMELRTRSAHLKDEVKQLKNQLKQAELDLKAADERAEGQLFKLRADNAALQERLKELELNSPEKKRANALEVELTEIRARNKEIQQELNAANAKMKSERNAAERLKQQHETLLSELKDLKAKYPSSETITAQSQPPLDPKQLERWKDRALTARHMYRMMRQMRELSDLKLSTYQEAVIEVSSSLLSLRGVAAPDLAPNENKADRLLAEAWALVQAVEPHSDTTSNA
jgi:chromosome segregation ATPase